jgi:predicted nucleic acid-binding protein
VLVYLRDPRFPEKTRRAAEWLRTARRNGRLVLSPQIVNELCATLLRRRFNREEDEDCRKFASGFMRWCTAPLDRRTVEEAMRLHSQHTLSWWDSVLLASALQVGADYLLSEDLQDGRRFGRLQIVDPFRIAPDDFLAALA